MTEKERLLAVLAGQKVDRPPCICPGGMMNMTTTQIAAAAHVSFPAAHIDPQEMARLSRASHDMAGLENYGAPFCMTVEAEAMGAVADLGDETCEPHVIAGVLAGASDLSAIHPIDVTQGRAATTIEAIRLLKEGNDDVPVVGNLVGPVSVAGTLLDFEKLLREMRRHPDDCHKLLAYVVDSLVVYGHAMLEAGADVICIAEPSGTGEILGPKWFGEFTVHYLNELTRKLAAPYIIVHICGKLERVLDEIAHIRCDGFSFDAVTVPSYVRAHLPGTALMGNVSTFALRSQDAVRVDALTQAALRQSLDVIAPACGISMSTPTENLLAMTDRVRKGTEHGR
ncbi:MAG: uroporphyrinogen decarboxylase family protein [Atopobiaceae bacterium]|jgi:MtaA/CmuA family methyltransferase